MRLHAKHLSECHLYKIYTYTALHWTVRTKTTYLIKTGENLVFKKSHRVRDSIDNSDSGCISSRSDRGDKSGQNLLIFCLGLGHWC